MAGNVNVRAPSPISGREGSLEQSSHKLITTLQWKTIRQGGCMGFSLFYPKAIYFLLPSDILSQ
jgi:hypothetical protein